MPSHDFARSSATASKGTSAALNEREREDDRRAPGGKCPPGMQERRKTVRRRANRVQGQGLEKLGHAVEYLMDSRMFVFEPTTEKAERDAVQILMRSSRAVFAECQEVVTIGDRLANLWDRLAGRLQEPEALNRHRPVVG